MQLYTRKEDGTLQEMQIGGDDLDQYGGKVFVHDECANIDVFYPNGKSFDDLPPDGGKAIRFSYTAKFHREGIDALAKASHTKGPQVTSAFMMVHHQHVVWIYAPTIQLVEKERCQLILQSMGPSFSKGTPLGAMGNNLPRHQTAPVGEIFCAIELNDGTLHPLPMQKEGDSYKAQELFPLNLLQEQSALEEAKIQLELTISKDYFRLSTLMGPGVEKPSVLPEAQRLLEVVLSGEKAPGWDWIITVGEGQPRAFFVHGPVLAHSSPLLEVAMSTHTTPHAKGCEILMVSHENRFILPKLSAVDMPAILSYFYLRSFTHLPDHMGFSRVGRLLCAILPSYAIGNMFASWEETIVTEVMAVDRGDYQQTLPLLARHLVRLYSAPFGSMPAAKKVLISTFADVWHMAETTVGKSELEKFADGIEELQLQLLKPAQQSVRRFYAAAGIIKKDVV